MRAPRISIVVCAGILLGAVAACQKSSQVESGAVLLNLTVAPEAPAPDELLVSVYGDGSALWQDARIPDEGALPAPVDGRLGSVLVQPGPSEGALRIDVRGLLAGSPKLEGALVIPAGQRGSFDLTLADGLEPDGDGDGIPDSIDDCPTVPDPSQSGCARDAAADRTDSAGGSGGAGGDSGSGETPDGGEACTVDGGCAKAIGALCGSSAECASSFCVDGVCCSTACLGACRSCNQPSSNGTCAAYMPGTDPELECTGGNSCNGAGACGPAPGTGSKTTGQLCAGASQCASGFCTDGVCCDSACTDACQTCATGSCQAVKKAEDIPECAAPMTCNSKGKCVAQ